MPTLWTIQMLGGLSAQRTGHELIRCQVRKTSSLLAYLAFHLNEDVSRETLIESLWPEVDVSRARHSLYEGLSILRRQLEPPDVEPKLVFQVDHSCIRVNGAAVTTDLLRLKHTVVKFTRSTDAEEQLGLLRRAASIYGGELLPGFFDDWVLAEREHLTRSYLRIFSVLISMLKRVGQSEEALEHLLRSIAITSDNEDLHEEALRLMIELGREADAMRHFEEYRERLNRTEGEAPGSEVWRIMEPYKERLKCVASVRKRAVRRKSVRPNAPPAAISPETSEAVVLPTLLTRFFGREQEIAIITRLLTPTVDEHVELLASGPTRLVTITGLGGCGKTRLATEAGRHLEKRGEFGNKIAFVPLSGLTREDDIPQAIADVLRVTTAGSSQALSIQIRDMLRRERWLLILDNCEHLPAAGQVVRSLLEDLPELRILATSRMPLGVDGEHMFGLQPLAVPLNITAPKSLYEFPSVQMFVNRAQTVCHDFQITDRNAETISSIMQRLEGIPLAIELAAAHVLTLTPSQILAALADRFDLLTSRRAKGGRQRALKETLDWSFELLSEEAQRFFVTLSVFRGGFTAEAVSAVCDQPNTRGLLHDLAERSLIMPEPGVEVMRFSMLDSLREYAAERLDEADKDSIACRHADFYLRLAQQSAPALRTNARPATLSVFDEAHGNLLAALEFVRGKPDELRFVAAV